eukprot:COSAG01_NODE_56270_length_319_cov_1.290909_1_plen_42_part_10
MDVRAADLSHLGAHTVSAGVPSLSAVCFGWDLPMCHACAGHE